MVLLLLWNIAITTAAAPLAWLLFLLTEIGTPLVLALWTLNVAWHNQMRRVLATVSAIGLFLVCLRSLVWGLNALLPMTSGFYTMAGILNLLAVVGSSLWLVWLGIAGIQLHSRGKKKSGRAQPLSTNRDVLVPKSNQRRNFLRLGVKVGVGVAGSGLVLARTGLVTANAPVIESDDVPAEPSLMGTLLYLMAVIFQRLNSSSGAAPQRPSTPARPSLPPGFSVERVNAAGVSALLICAPGATKSRALLYIHGGAFRLPAIEAHYPFVAQLSREIGACVLMPDYRLAPENPFPAALQDCVAAYQWLRSQGIAASRLAIAGDSSGGNLTLATALALREQGEALPAALVALSPALDLTTTGADPILGENGLKNAYAAYTNNGAIDAHQPLVSPLYADVHRLPPTFLLVGTQEALRRDSLRMADKLRKAGVEVKLEIWPGMWHVWPISYFGDVFPEAPLTRKHMTKFIRQRLQ
ncbi:hypothetical protein KSZ_38830 [Dictyobacter formicarum]|uniref:Alpha/beta hydrolase fold-3 domain-containing protein n=2 Tax=Dictyobacter formicarum TaxID=2778368 RepID=A0ABQ3VI71_9CHLR|nr:hypothetical protein KSZ_38830 [Dictyobacter formicarum]